MHFPRCSFQIILLIGVGLILGCSDRPTGMRNMQPETASKEQKDPSLKKDKNLRLPPDPPAPVVPPR